MSRVRDKLREMLRVAIYVRISSYNQKDGYSLPGQIKASMESCRQMNWEVRYIYKEVMGAGNTNRPKFQLMMEKAMNGAFDVVVVWKLDRLCRSLADLVNTERQLREAGVGIYSATEMVDTTSSVGRFNFRNLASAAEFERDMIKDRARMGMQALARERRWPNGVPPLGYDLDEEGRLKVNEEEAELVRRIYELYLRHKSMAHVSFLLNDEGSTTKRGKRWTGTKIKEILDNEIYRGRYQVADVDEYIEGYRIIEDGIFEIAKEHRKKYNKKKMKRRRKSVTIGRIFERYLDSIDRDKTMAHCL